MNRLLQILLLIALLSILAIQLYKGVHPNKDIAAVCPVNAIAMNNGKAVIEAGKCIGCRRCVDGVVIPTVSKANSKPLADPPVTQPVFARLAEEFQKSDTSNNPVKPAPKSDATKVADSKPTPSRQAHKVNPDTCIGCTLCVRNCPTNAITMIDGKAVIDKDKCINCGICVKGNNNDFAGCPVSAISAP